VSGESVDRVLVGQSLACALVGVVEVLGELIDERIGLDRERQRAAGVLTRGVPRGVGEKARARASANRSLGVT
jgi:hypothetical protein